MVARQTPSVQPDPKTSSEVPLPADGIDAASGLPNSVLKSGTGENLGKEPATVTVIDIPGSEEKNNVGA